ncbi:MAG: hypothetical protein L0H53_11830 [Candidatus Nitrosocosmicus sp.]|nr:hypothetical protein [Candidatus Nitrosocosmicus sp.]MDN5868968.1 hypothetical protein [Candidatus Nitrosocosmicus sp.]
MSDKNDDGPKPEKKASYVAKIPIVDLLDEYLSETASKIDIINILDEEPIKKKLNKKDGTVFG